MPDYGDLAYSLSGLARPSNPYDAKRKMAMSFMQQGADFSPVQSPWQGASRLAQSLLGAWMLNSTDTEEQAKNKQRTDALAQAMAEPDPQKRIGLIAAYDPEAGARAAGSLAVEQAKLQEQNKMLQAGAQGFGSSYGAPSQGGPQGQPGSPQQAIGGFESGNDYGAVNKQTGAAGKYQVIPANIGPWTKQFYGQELTPQQFLQNPQAQEAVFQGKFVGEYLPKYGPQGARAAWFAGEGGMNNPRATDANGVSVAQYVQRTGGGQPPQPQATGAPVPLQPQAPIPQGAGPQAAPGMPPPPSPQGVTGPTVTAAQPPVPPAVPDVPRPQPTPQMLQQYQQRIMSGEFGQGPDAVSKARAALDADLDRQWSVARDTAKMRFDQENASFGRRESNDLQQPQNNIQNEAKMREQFDTLQSVKDYRKANTVFRSAIEAAKNDTKASDLNLVYAFATLMDPGSVVRDSESGMVTATQSASDRVKALVASVSGRATFSPEARQNLLAEMSGRYEAYKTAHDDLASTFGGIADRSGINRQNVVVPYPEVKYERPQVRQMAPASGASASDIDAELKRRGLAQ